MCSELFGTGMADLGPMYLSDWPPQMGQICDLFKLHFSTFSLTEPKCTNYDLKKSWICPFWDQSDKTDHRVSPARLLVSASADPTIGSDVIRRQTDGARREVIAE